jgi:hypothetical protein
MITAMLTARESSRRALKPRNRIGVQISGSMAGGSQRAFDASIAWDSEKSKPRIILDSEYQERARLNRRRLAVEAMRKTLLQRHLYQYLIFLNIESSCPRYKQKMARTSGHFLFVVQISDI